MLFYIVKNKYFPNTSVCKKFLPAGICQDLFSMSSDFSEIDSRSELFSVPAQEIEFVLAIRSYILRQSNQSDLRGAYLSIGDPDYKPVAFLERAFRLSASVCRITQGMPFGNLIPLIKHWNPQDAPEMCRVLEEFFKSSPRGSSWEEYWKPKTFEDVFERNNLDGRACENNQQIIFVPYATGFLVGKSHVLTNFHVLNATEHEKNLDDFRVQFRYERNLNNRDLRPTEYKLKSILSDDSELDYTLLEIANFPEIDLVPSEQISLKGEDLRRAKLRKAKLSFEKAGENFGWLRMNSVQPVIPNISPTQIEEAEPKIENQFGPLKPDEKILLYKSKRQGGIQGESIIMIQHPRGRAKEIVAFNSNILEASESYIQYTTDTDFGSSGSPILNGNLQLIGLHFGALIKCNPVSSGDGNNEINLNPKNDKHSVDIKANIGTRTNAVVRHLKAIQERVNVSQATKNKVNEFIREYIDGQNASKYTEEKCKFPRRIFLLGGLERDIPGDAAFTQKLVDEMGKKLDIMSEASQLPKVRRKYQQVEIINALGDIKLFSGELNGDDKKRGNKRIPFSKLRILSDPQLSLKMAIAWINMICDFGDNGNDNEPRSYLPGDVALQFVTERYETEELQLKLKQLKRKSLLEQELDPLPRGMLVYHVSDNRERRAHAELILDKLSDGIPTLRSRGALSDFISREGRLTFCRDLYMPSLVVSLGFLEHPLDQQILGANENSIFDEDQLKKLASELLEAVIDWSEALNPDSFSPNEISQ
jgi:V8-like Glu-specific endopeptidase